MQIIQLQPIQNPRGNPRWIKHLFAAKAAQSGGIVRRAVRDVEREVGREAFLREVAGRGFHVVECSGQFIVICSQDHMTVHL